MENSNPVKPISSVHVVVADESHARYIPDILGAIFEASKVPGNSIVMRDPDYLALKMREGKAVIALCDDGSFAGFCYLECWQDEQFLANSGMIVKPEYRGQGLATRIKQEIVRVCHEMFPDAAIFGITKSEAIKKISLRLGFEEVPYSEITTDPKFWKGCDTCRHYSELLANNVLSCHCTALLLRPNN